MDALQFSMDDAMIALEHSLREGTFDKEALEELKNKKEPKKTYWDFIRSGLPKRAGVLLDLRPLRSRRGQANSGNRQDLEGVNTSFLLRPFDPLVPGPGNV